jgi:hypothetical protein
VQCICSAGNYTEYTDYRKLLINMVATGGLEPPTPAL